MTVDCSPSVGFGQPYNGGLVERWIVWLLPPLIGAGLGVAVGPFSGFDLLNRRWMTGWVMLSGADGLYGGVASLLTKPWLHDGAIALLLAPGRWWLGPAVLGALHGLIASVSYGCIRATAIRLSRASSFLLAMTSILTPLVLMHVGRESGHLLAGLFLALSVRAFLLSPQRGLYIGLLLGVAPLLKVAALLSALALSLAFIVGLKGAQRIRFVAGFALCMWFGALVPSLLVMIKSGTFSTVEVWGQPVSVVNGALISSGLVVFASRLNRCPNSDLFLGRFVKSSRTSALFLVSGIVALTWLVRWSEISDPRFMPPSISDLGRQLFMSGNVRVPTALSDWEVLYLDNSRMVVVVFTLVAFVLMIGRSQRAGLHQRMLLAAIAIGGSVILVQATMGYVRYSSQSLALLPIAIGCVIGLNQGRALWRELLVMSVSAIILLPVVDVGVWFRAPGLKTYGDLTTLLSRDETQLLSDLLPEDGTVFLFGNLTAAVAPATDRRDVKWLVSPKRPEHAGTQVAELLYDPSNTRDLDRFTTRGWNFDACQTLRFRKVSYGWCSMSTDQGSDSAPP